MKILVLRILFICIAIFHSTIQICQEEISNEGISVTWHQTPTANNVESDPTCYLNDTLITRNCTNSSWTPTLNDIGPCLKVVKYFDLNSCPPGFYKISDNNNDYCYQIGESSVWNSPCFASGGASVITDLSAAEIDYLLNSLIATNTSRYFWLPAQRHKLFHPIVWTIPGPNWGQRISPNIFLRLQAFFTKNCLLLDIEQGVLTTEICSKNYPSLCFYINDLHYPTKCPDGYQSFRFKLNNGTCYGIETSYPMPGMSFNDFLNGKCKSPMINSEHDLTRFIFKKISEINKLPNGAWCWFRTPLTYQKKDDIEYMHKNDSLINYSCSSFEGIINKAGVLGLMNSSALLPCMACEIEVIYGKTEFMFEYNEIQNKIYLTVYYPTGLWKYDNDDKGIQCFSDAKGFVRVVDVNDIPFMEVTSARQDEIELANVEKIVYIIDLVTDSSAQYWCEGHTVNFSFIATDKIIVNPKGNEVHVFALVIKYYVLPDDVDMTNLTDLTNNITKIFLAKRVLIMDIFDYLLDNMVILLHVHIAVEDVYGDEALNIQETFNTIQVTANLEFPKYNYTFVSLSSSVYCLPTTSVDFITLDWGLTSIGHISAPKQFCLQANGLPVKRLCQGSYMLGGIWGKVEGYCDNTYEPSLTTTFLYNFVKMEMPNNYTSRFLTDGLNFVLGDTDIIIPADIYYLSMSLQQILDVAEENATAIDTGDIDNIAWAMDRMMVLDWNYLRLAQTLNSTNVILDSVSDIIEMIAQRSLNESSELSDVAYQLAIKPQFIVQITYPEFNNITGIAIIKNSASDDFSDMLIQPLYKNTSLEEVLSIQNLEIATWLPEQVLDTIQINNNESEENTIKKEILHITITLFHNDAIFQELAANKHTINSRIVGVSIPEYLSNLEYPVPLVFKQINQTENYFCGYWDFQPKPHHHNIPGSWKKQGCFIVKIVNDTTVCECYHLTHFGQLLSIPNSENEEEIAIDEKHTTALNIITLIGSFLSLLGIIGIWITALVFGSWRKKAGTKVLLQLSTAIALPLLFILIFNLDYTIFIQVNGRYVVAEHMKPACVVLGSLLHFSILASFMWMLITAILQFIRYVRVLGVSRPSRFMVKFTLIGWGIPLLPVITTLVLDAENYIPSSSVIKKICYPNGFYLIIGVIVPICIILFVNITLFILVLYAIARGPDQKIKTTDMDLVSAQLRVSIFLFFLLGLTWIFGIFSFSNHLLWSYLFCLTSTLQGFVLFIYFVICDPNTRNLWITLMKPQFVSNSSRNSITSITTG